jgi:hypothetical protein
MELSGKKIVLRHAVAIEKTYLAAIRSNPEGVVGLTFVPIGTPISDRDTTSYCSKCMKNFGSELRTSVLILEGQGIWAMTLRTVARGLMLAAGSHVPRVLICEEARDACEQIAPEVVYGQKPVGPLKLASVASDSRALYAKFLRTNAYAVAGH